MRRSCLRALCCAWTVSAVALCASVPGWAYQEIAVVNGGHVTGSIRFEGQAPEPLRFELRRSPDRAYCGAISDGSGYRFLRDVAVGADGGLKDVVVTIEHVEQGKPFDFTETKLEASMCQFVPFVSVMRDQRPLSVTNLDSVAHDLQVYERDPDHVFIMFHRPALTKSGTSDVIRFTGNRRAVTMQCGMHPYMQGHGLAVDNPYYAITGLEGNFTIKDLPAGAYRIKAWHPILGERVQDVTVVADATTASNFLFEAK